MKTLSQLRTELEVYQESFQEAETQTARERYRKLCVETADEIDHIQKQIRLAAEEIDGGFYDVDEITTIIESYL